MRVEQLLHQIAVDNRSGAAEILERAVGVFDALTSSAVDETTPFEARAVVIDACAALAKAQPLMAPLLNLAGAVIRSVKSCDSAAQGMKSAAGAAREFLEKSRRAVATAIINTSEIVADGANILTHSRSSTVARALIAARNAGKCFSVIATESRPLLEGRTLAEELAREGISVTLVCDAAAALIMPKVTCVLLGADQVTPSVVVNKIGTRMIALAANEASVPVYAVSDSTKFINAASAPTLEPEHEPGELWLDAPAGVLISNRYFEETPLSFFSAIIAEDGLLTPDAARERAQRTAVNPELAALL